jgi:hypothetical protein
MINIFWLNAVSRNERKAEIATDQMAAAASTFSRAGGVLVRLC